MTLDSDTAERILGAYNRDRGSTPRATRIAARPNRRTLASVRRLRCGRVRLNVATAVVQAGPPAWRLLGPALDGESDARRELAGRCRPGLVAARREGPPSGSPRGSVPGAGSPLADTRCQGSDRERRILRLIVDWARAVKGYASSFPEELQLRVSRRMSSSYGSHMTRGGVHRITVSHRLFRSGVEDLLLDTTLHELAHVLDACTNPRGRSFHDAAWRAWCRRLGAEPRRLMPPDAARRVRAAQRHSDRSGLPAPVARWAEADRQTV